MRENAATYFITLSAVMLRLDNTALIDADVVVLPFLLISLTHLLIENLLHIQDSVPKDQEGRRGENQGGGVDGAGGQKKIPADRSRPGYHMHAL
jgi:hypothetical protein